MSAASRYAGYVQVHEYDFCGRCGDWAKIWRLRDEFVMLKGRGKIANYAAAER